jgi:16S rRNA (guanine527-N7)-methyltransferase
MKKILASLFDAYEIDYDDDILQKFNDYYYMLIEYNKVMNLTSITEVNDVAVKHFLDSVILLKYVSRETFDDKLVADVGTGAGFPGIPLAILLPDAKFILIDSLQKRLKFLEDLIRKLELSNVKLIHGRAEDLGHDKAYRGNFDYVVSRAVAPLNILLEYDISFLKVNGELIAYKSQNIDSEIISSKHALNELNCKLTDRINFLLPDNSGDSGNGTNADPVFMERNILFISKNGPTKNVYPRKAGTPKKKPL